MKKTKLLTSTIAAALFSISSAYADTSQETRSMKEMGNMQEMGDMKNKMKNKMEKMEKCKVVKDGVGMIKAHKGDCKSEKSGCSGHNEKGDPEAWILVPKGLCDKINKAVGDGTLRDNKEIPDEIKGKIEGCQAK